MNVSLTPQLEAYIHDKVASGQYTSASEVVRQALRVMQDAEAERAEQLAALREKVAEGVAQYERGETSRFDPDAIKAEGRNRLRNRE